MSNRASSAPSAAWRRNSNPATRRLRARLIRLHPNGPATARCRIRRDNMGQRTCTTAISLTLALTLAAHSAEAALRNRTFVSGNGLDTNPCSVAQPCRTFAFAITQTAPGGGITILDPANYGPVTISQAISIINEGIGEASVQTTSAVDAITVSAGTTDNV